MQRTVSVSILSAALVFSAALSVNIRAGEGPKGLGGQREGPLQHILDHATELNLSAEQATKIEALQKEIGAKLGAGGGELREKLKEHPEALALYKEMKEARDSGDEAKAKAAREKLREFAAKNGVTDGKTPAGGAAKMGEIREKLAAILTPAQLKQVKEMMDAVRAKNGGGLGGAGATPQGQKPDTSKEAPKVFE